MRVPDPQSGSGISSSCAGGTTTWKWSVPLLCRRGNHNEISIPLKRFFVNPHAGPGDWGSEGTCRKKTEAVGLAGGRLRTGRNLPEKTEAVGLAGGRLGIGRDLPAEGKHGRDD